MITETFAINPAADHTDAETQSLIDEIMSMEPDGPELTDADKDRLDLLLAEELTPYDVEVWELQKIKDRLDAGEVITGKQAIRGLGIALEQIECRKVITKMLQDALRNLHSDNQRLQAILNRPTLLSNTSGNA